MGHGMHSLLGPFSFRRIVIIRRNAGVNMWTELSSGSSR
jgi:hypothetical protein